MIYTLNLHDALPIYGRHCQSSPPSCADQPGVAAVCGCIESKSRYADGRSAFAAECEWAGEKAGRNAAHSQDRKSTRLNSSHITISYAVFCLKKKIR